MQIYKLRHIPTGEFFKPSRHRSKSNLSSKGKIYAKKPTLKFLGKAYNHPITKDPKKLWPENYEVRTVIAEDWEIVEYEVTEN